MAGAQPSLQALIRKERRKTASGRYIIPERALRTILNEDQVQLALRQHKCEPYKIAELTKRVLKGGRKLFCILALCHALEEFKRFVLQDGLYDNHIDTRLPFDRDQLMKIVEGEDLADQILERQWEFLAPIFRDDPSHRVLREETILPFHQDVFRQEGGFGKVYDIGLIDGHHRLYMSSLSGSPTLVRKSIRIGPDNTEDLRREEHILSFLRGLRHPHILRLVASYTLNGEYNMLFPKAEYDLEIYLKEQPPEQFRVHATIVSALSGLASALEALHNYTHEGYGVSFVGSHLDLRPKNILVSNDKFLLADFGLSRLKPLEEGSKTTFKEGVGDCMAPECFDDENSCQTSFIGRPSDIWSFGCVLTLLLTHMIEGPDGVEEFRRKRRVSVKLRGGGRYIHYKFHADGNLTPAVEAQLASHGESHLAYVRRLSIAGRSILRIDASLRPDGRAVDQSLRDSLLLALCHRITELFDEILPHSESMEDQMGVERHRFHVWSNALGSCEPSESLCRGTSDGFCAVIDSLHTITRELDFSQTTHPNQQLHATVKSIAKAINTLWNEANTRPEVLLMARKEWLHLFFDGQDSSKMRETYDAIMSGKQSKEMASVAAASYIMSLVQNDRSAYALKFLLDPELLRNHKRWGEHEVAEYGERSVLIESIRYSSKWIKQGTRDVGRELYERIGAKVEILHMSQKPPEMRTLHCVGYYHDPLAQSFKLVFDVGPKVAAPQPPMHEKKPLFSSGICSLSDILHQFRGSNDPLTRPTRASLLKLAVGIAETVLMYHQVGWMHKDICSANILLIVQPSGSISDWICSPFLTGFQHSRQNVVNAFSDGASQLMERYLYVHPKYLPTSPPGEMGSTFRLEYDYHSLGIVLLEIGLWSSIMYVEAKMTKSLKGTITPERRRKHLTRGTLPSLGWTIGGTYRDAVHFCLNEQNWANASQDKDALTEQFRRNVVDTLRSCTD
ncbi:kinase-like protein [Lophiostoma macrostomum CBS 122681]|uniref:Kinase-like protein n=1 Tax=Lophiostoma macrostomum CBS 122681 TaxID=1314788 RepID=A0A6A6THI6_9PLEO|nr:kinase-like protein [Lophiostoma macrostomum CBS 122681]